MGRAGGNSFAASVWWLEMQPDFVWVRLLWPPSGDGGFCISVGARLFPGQAAKICWNRLLPAQHDQSRRNALSQSIPETSVRGTQRDRRESDKAAVVKKDGGDAHHENSGEAEAGAFSIDAKPLAGYPMKLR